LVFEFTLAKLKKAWRGMAGGDFNASVASMNPDLPKRDAARVREQMESCLNTKGGEVSARGRAAALGEAYLALNTTGRKKFLKILAADFDINPRAVDAAVERYRAAAGPDEDGRRALTTLQHALVAPRITLLTQFNGLPAGVKFLVDLREELRGFKGDDPDLNGLERDLRGLLRTWFDIDFLELKQISWDTAPGALLEKLVEYEAVHAIRDWQDLKNRLESDRRCFAYFHPRMPNEPLIFVEVALVNGLAGNVAELLDKDAPAQDPDTADTAIFYSISSAQAGLAGISFGNFLIKRVVDSLSKEFKQLRQFSTLSPIPGFRAWLSKSLADGEGGYLNKSDFKSLAEQGKRMGREDHRLLAFLSRTDWTEDTELAQVLSQPLMRLAARYLIDVKHPRRTALDSVAHFHLTNGSRVERLNWMADPSPKGLEQSAGIMVNYFYDLSEIDDNHEAYTSDGTVRASAQARAMAKG
jgi:malonyl-CoA decarboxylase